MKRELEADYLVRSLDRTPPWLVRVMAIRPGRGARPTKRIPEAEIIRRSGLSRRAVIKLSYSKTWNHVRLDMASRFASACGVNLLGKNPLYFFFRTKASVECDYLTKAQKRALDRLRAE